MKTTIYDKFLNEDHKRRFNNLIDIRNDYANDINYTPAGYLLAADEEVYNKAVPFISKAGISFSEMLKKQDFSTGKRVLVLYAYDLFTGGTSSMKNLSLTDLSACDADMIPAVFNAILLYIDWDNKAAGHLCMKTMMKKIRKQCGADHA